MIKREKRKESHVFIIERGNRKIFKQKCAEQIESQKQIDLLEDGVQNHRGASHIAAVLQQGDQEVHDHHQRQEANDRDSRTAAAEELSRATSSETIQIVGNVITLFRQKKKDSKFSLPKDK